MSTQRLNVIFFTLYTARIANEYIRPSCLVTDAKGVQIQKKFWKELIQKLEKVAPGIESNI